MSGCVRNGVIDGMVGAIDPELVVGAATAELAEALVVDFGHSVEIESFGTALVAPLKVRAHRIVHLGLHNFA